MSFTFSDSPIHKRFLCFVLAFIFCLFVLIFPFSLSASAASTDDFLLLTIATLDSWGISFSSPSSSDVDVLSLFGTMFSDFLDFVGESSSSFWSGARAGVDKLGNILLDHTTVGKIISFYEWLTDAYDLKDNDRVYSGLPGGYFLSDGSPIVFSSSRSNLDGTFFQSNVSYSTSLGTVFTLITSANSVNFTSTAGANLVSSVPSVGNYMTRYTFISPSEAVFEIGFGTDTTINRYFVNLDVSSILGPPSSSSDGLFIDTLIINVPSISSDDGIVLTVPGADWGDTFGDILDLIESLIALYDSTQLDVLSIIESIANIVSALITPVSVDNIPGGIVMDYDNYDVPLDVVWDDVDSFYSSDYSGPIFLILKDLIFGLPSPFVTFFSVTVIFVVAYGFIRMGRDSH